MTEIIFRSVTALLERGRVLREETTGLARQLSELSETDRHEAPAASKSKNERDRFSGPQAKPA